MLPSLADAAVPPTPEALPGGAVALKARSVANSKPGDTGLPEAMLLLTVDAVSFNMVALYELKYVALAPNWENSYSMKLWSSLAL